MWSLLLNKIQSNARALSLITLPILIGFAIYAIPEITHAGFVDSVKAVGSQIYNLPYNFIRAILTLLGTMLMWAGAVTLTLSGQVFNYLMIMTIINFTGELYNHAKSGIEIAWAVFRDIANILIIGMTVFIAISTILGVAEYNAKKLLANILIIAVLINFSLLFTKMVIDASNYTATQFYSAMNVQSNSAASADSGWTDFTKNGIAGNFLKIMGVSSVGDTWSTLWNKAADANGDPGQWKQLVTIIIHSLFGSIMLLGAAAILFFGSYLMLSRALLMLFLLITSSLAFASYLVPSLKSMGWDPWWDSLKKNAFFAPLFMMLLWIALKVTEGLATNTQTGSIGSLLDNPNSNGDNVKAFVTYIIVLGLLYTAFKLSDLFSHSIGGLSYANATLDTGIRYGSWAGGKIFRNTAGRLGSYLAGGVGGKEQNLRDRAKDATGWNKLQLSTRAFLAETRKGAYANVAKSDGNIGGLLATGLKKAGLTPGNIAANTRGGYTGEVAKQAAEVAKRAEASTRSDKDKEKALEDARKEFLNAKGNEEHKQKMEEAEAMVTTTKDAVNAAVAEGYKIMGTESTKQHEAAISQLKETHKALAAEYEKAKAGPDVYAARDAKAKMEAAEKEIITKQSERDNAIKNTTARITQAQSNAALAAVQHQQASAEVNEALFAQRKDLKAMMERTVNDTVNQMDGSFSGWAISTLPGVGGISNAADVRKKAQKLVGENAETASIKKFIAAAGEKALPKPETGAPAAGTPAAKPAKK